jgi:hypothetical protein
MLSDLQYHWPPSFPDVSGEDGVDPHVGHRSTFGRVVGIQRESLFELHEGAWWTGCRFAVPPDEPSRTIRCQILVNGGGEVFHSWTQETGDWHLFPWPIPAAFAREHGLVLTVELAEAVNPPVMLSRRISFQEMPDMPREAHYMFVDGDDGYARLAWNGIQGNYSRRADEGAEPQWNIPYILVPWSDYLATGRPWTLARTYTPTDWSVRPALDGAP